VENHITIHEMSKEEGSDAGAAAASTAEGMKVGRYHHLWLFRWPYDVEEYQFSAAVFRYRNDEDCFLGRSVQALEVNPPGPLVTRKTRSQTDP
jgi:hypothetical protein